MALSDESYISRPDAALRRLRARVTAPAADPAEARLGAICLWAVQQVEWLSQEVGRLQGELDELTDYVIEDQRFGITGERPYEHRDAGLDGGPDGSFGPAAVADHDAWQ
jgi:hypothetical protein